ncbi:MAG: cation:dicarboxylase symporter family transporter [Spirochaetes bacterium]|nr:cation:dicarboxylase symporter family transporter [Spirochaetota bacterium]
MKIWIKYLIGLILGLIAGFIFSNNPAAAAQAVRPFVDIFINIGRYTFYPLIFFSLAIGVHELVLNSKFFRVCKNAIMVMVAAVFASTIVGVLIALIFSPHRIPIILEKKTVEVLPSFLEQFLAIFPKNLFSVFSDSGNFIIPTVFLALLLGLNFGFDKVITKPIVTLFDSFNRIMYNINSLIMEVMAPAMGFLSAYLLFSISSVTQIALYKQLFLILFIASAFMIFVVFPGVLWLIGLRDNPYKHLYAILGAGIAGFLSGDNYLANNVLIRHCHNNLGISRPTGTVSISLFSMFGRPGTAMVTAICFIVMLKSYTSIGIGFAQVLYFTFLIFIISFTLSTAPGSGVLVLLTAVCAAYGSGIEDGFLIFRPILPLLLSFAVLVDVIATGICALIISHRSGDSINDPSIREFI